MDQVILRSLLKQSPTEIPMKVSIAIQVDSELKDVWAAFSSMSGIVNYHPWVINSPLLSKNDTGVGASRRCEFKDGTSIVETITELREREYISMTFSETPMPLKSGVVEVAFSSSGSGTEIKAEMDVKIGLGPLGWIIGPLFVRSLMKNRFEKAMLSMDQYIKTGTKFDTKGNATGLSLAAA